MGPGCLFGLWGRVVGRWVGSRVVGSMVRSRRSSPVVALTTRTWRSWMSRMTWVPAWVRPMPMWWSRPCDAQGDGAGFVDAVVADPVVGVGVAVGAGRGFGQRVVERRRGGPVGQRAVRAVVVVVRRRRRRAGSAARRWWRAGRVGRGATSSWSAGSVRPCRRWWGGWVGSSSGRRARRGVRARSALRPPRPPAKRAV